MTEPGLALLASEQCEGAARLAARLDIPLCTQPPATGPWLHYDAAGLALRSGRHLLRVDFTVPVLQRRLLAVSRREALVRACGAGGGARPPVLDATAGLGVDCMLLAARGCRVQAWERHPVIHALLADGLARAAAHAELAVIAARVELHCGDVRVALAATGVLAAAMRPQVVSIDPMFEQRGRAANRIALRLLTMLGARAGADGRELVRLARQLLPRTVVKRRRHAPPLAGPPDWQIDGGSVRFDVYAG